MDSMSGGNKNTNPMNALSALQMLKSFQQGGMQGVINNIGTAYGGSNLGGGMMGQNPIFGGLFNSMTKNLPMSDSGISQIANGAFAPLPGAGGATQAGIAAANAAPASAALPTLGPLSGASARLSTLAPAAGATGAAASAGAGAAGAAGATGGFGSLLSLILGLL